MATARQLGPLLIEAAVLTEDELAKAESMASGRGLTLERAIVQLGLADESKVYKALAKASGLPFVSVAKMPPASVLERIPKEQIEQDHLLPVGVRDGALYVAIDDPLKTFVADNLAFLAGSEVRCALTPPGELKAAIGKVVGAADAVPATATASDSDADAPIIRLVHKTINEAIDARASDIHIEPFERSVRARYRVDGVLRTAAEFDVALLGPLTSRLKIMAALDIAEKRKPQDGRVDYRDGQRRLDIRLSVLPSNHGESIVMRLLDKEKGLMSLEALGFGADDNRRFERIIKRPNGILLVTGPTGSGKTTSLYAALQQLNRPDVKIITAEDPVEFNIAGINQCLVRSRIGLTFARILRAMLRQAPNVILVGEIRDRETAEIAIQAALTGHLVFSTLHTNDAPSAITRLIDMGVKPFLVSAAIQAVMAQRLVRVLCPECRRAYEPDEVALKTLGLTPDRYDGRPFYSPVGCAACDDTGYRGRLGIFELMEMDSQLRDMTFRGASTPQLREYARSAGGMATLTEDGIRKIFDGTTSLQELLRVTAAM